MTEKFFTIITQHNRESALEWVATEFQSQYETLRGIQVAQVTTATPLSPSLRQEVTKLVREQTGHSTVTLNEKVDPGLIGGFVLRVGDRQIDDSVRSRLNRLRNTLKETSHQSQL